MWVVRIPLYTGWNLVSLPVVPLNSAPNVVFSQMIRSGALTAVWSYTGSPTPAWKFFAPGKTSTLTTITDGMGLWVLTTTSATLYLQGCVIPPAANPPQYTLALGWNLVGFKPQPTIQNDTLSHYLSSISGKYDSANVWLYDNSGSWVRAQDATWLKPGQAIWIFMTAPATLRP